VVASPNANATIHIQCKMLLKVFKRVLMEDLGK